MDKASRAVVSGSRLFNALHRLPRPAKKRHEIIMARSKAAPLQLDAAGRLFLQLSKLSDTSA